MVIGLIVVSAAVRLPGLMHRAIWGDEAITLMETAGHPLPAWPTTPTAAGVVQHEIFEGSPNLRDLVDDLGTTDVHPPMYYWCLSLWRRWLGFSLETARAFSLVCSVAAVIALYLLLRIGKFPHPLTPTAIYALSSISVHSGQTARDYAMASMWVMLGALFAWLSAGPSGDHARRRAVYGVAMAICCGFAFYTNYLALFPSGAILAWFLVCTWSRSWTLAVLSPALSVAIWLTLLPVLSRQLGARPEYSLGFRGAMRELQTLLRSNVHIIAAPSRFEGSGPQVVFVALLFVALLGITGFQLVRHRSEVPRRLLWLGVILAVVPSVGMFSMNVASNKHLDMPRYVMLAAPFLAVVLAYGVSSLRSSLRYAGAVLLLLLLSSQLLAINWGSETTASQPGGRLRSLARLVDASSSPPHLVMVSRGVDYGRGPQGALIYELHPETMVVSVANDGTLNQLPPEVKQYADLWLALYPLSEAGEAQILGSLRRAEDYVEIALERESYDGRGSVYHFRRRAMRNSSSRTD